MIFFWTILLVVLATMLARLLPVRRRAGAETSLEKLQRRYASGELSTDDYDDLRRRF